MFLYIVSYYNKNNTVDKPRNLYTVQGKIKNARYKRVAVSQMIPITLCIYKCDILNDFSCYPYKIIAKRQDL